MPKHQLAAMYGSAHWLQRVFVECMASAVRAARPGGMLHIEHRQMSPRALIVLRDSGVFTAAPPYRAKAGQLDAAAVRPCHAAAPGLAAEPADGAGGPAAGLTSSDCFGIAWIFGFQSGFRIKFRKTRNF